MKNKIIDYLKMLMFYMFIVIVCSLLFSTCIYFKWIKLDIINYLSYVLSFVLLTIICIFHLYKTEKKAYLSTVGFIAFITTISLCLMPFFSLNLINILIRNISVLLISILFLLRK